jgi:tripartite-type tricarboxylate transporter receptor subunit TctC
LEFTWRNSCLGLLAALAAGCGACYAHAEEFYRGKSITIIIGSGPAGSYDNFGRLAGRHLGRFIPGNPTIVVQNVPGAGSIQAANFIYNVGPKDGTALGLMSPSTTVMQTFQGARYDATRFRWIGRINSNTNVTFVRSDSGINDLEDARAREVSLGTTAPTSPLSFQTRVVNHIAGTKFHLIVGYVDAAASLLAVERGEVAGGTTAWNTLKTAKPEWLKSGFVKVILQYGLTRNPELPDVPLAGDVVKDVAGKRILDVFMNAGDVGYSLMAAPETPEDRVQILRSAFSAMTKDSEFQKDAERIESNLEPLDGAQLEALIKETSTISDDVRAAAIKALTSD